MNWFDLVVMAVLVVGILRGRKRGMSEELLDVLQWLCIVVVSAKLYRPFGQFLSGYTHLNLPLSYILVYLFLAVLIKLLFTWVKRMMGEKLVESDVFGRLEYYLGMMAGALRFFCILLAVLAVLHARLVTPEELAAQAKMQRENFGTISFPTIGSIQQDVFVNSMAGTFINKYLNDQLIAATSSSSVVQREGLARKREKLVDEAIEAKPRK